MNITFKWMGKQTMCQNCEKPILLDEAVAVHSWRNKRGFTGRLFYHPECLLERYLFRLKMETPKPYRFGRGRKSLGLPVAEMKRRKTLLQKVRRGTIKSDEKLELERMDETRQHGVPSKDRVEEYSPETGYGQETSLGYHSPGPWNSVFPGVTVGVDSSSDADPAGEIDG